MSALHRRAKDPVDVQAGKIFPGLPGLQPAAFCEWMIHPGGGKFACNVILAFSVPDKVDSIHFSQPIFSIFYQSNEDLHFVDKGIDLAFAPA
jgi:hypothetical protein